MSSTTSSDDSAARPGRRGYGAWIERILCAVVLLAGYAVRAKIASGWTFAGSDTYAYIGAASELREAHRFGFRLPLWIEDRPKDTPPGYCRMPGYPLFLAATLKPPLRDYPSVFARAKPVQQLLDLATCVLVFFAARRIGGRLAAWPAFLAVTFHPILILFSAAILTETLATFLSTAALSLVLFAVIPKPKPGPAWLLVLAGVVMGLGQLVRIEGFVLLPCLLVPLVVRPSFRTLRTVLWALLAFVLVFSPWPLRNLAVFGTAHPLAGVCDVRGEAMPRTAFLGWFSTWLVQEAQTPPTLYCFFRSECVSSVAAYPAEAFDSPSERSEVEALFKLRATEGLSVRVDAGFRSLTWRRFRSHPLRSLVWLPAKRAFYLWVSRNDQPLRATDAPPWPAVLSWVKPALLPFNTTVALLGLLGLLLVATQERFRDVRGAAWLGAVVIFGRTGFVALIGFVDARYVLEVLPFLLALAGVAIAQMIRLARRPLLP